MNQSEQDLQRRELIFRVLDDLKNNGERINADKVARLAKMGKQTILPYYKEWRFLDDVERDQQEELPEDLTRILKRGIAKWKHALAQRSQEFEEQANVEIDELKQTVRKLSDDLSERDKIQTALEGRLTDVSQQLSTQVETGHEKNQQIAGLAAQIKALEQNNTEAQKTIEQQKLEHQAYTQQLEKKLDERHQEQLNHWITVVDNERRQKQDLEKQLAKTNEQLLAVEKDRSELNNRLDAKNRSYMNACEDRNRFKSEYNTLKPKVQLVEQCALLLDCSDEEIVNRLRTMQSAELKCSHNEARLSETQQIISSLQQSLGKAETKLEQVNTLEVQLEKAKSYAEALETRLPALDKVSEQ